jgi:hypothetical protein
MASRATLARAAPPVLWMGVIAGLSSGRFGADETGAWLLPLLGWLLPGAEPGLLRGLHLALRKLGHLVEYGILAALWLRALEPAPRAAAWAVGLSALYGLVDEARQALAPNRSPSLLDAAIDGAGALIAVACLRPGSSLAAAGVRLLRGAAVAVALGSLAGAALDWSLGLAAWDLVLAAALAGGLALALGRLGREAQPPR